MLENHAVLEKNSILLLLLATVTVSIGGLVEIVPLFRIQTTIEPVKGVRPLTPLELAGQNIYIREGCSVCHSQQIRPLRDEVQRYGHYSLAAESMYDHPFLWGSKRTGPDLARVGGKYSDEWHTQHLTNPRAVVPESIMPTYRFLYNTKLNITNIKGDIKALKTLGVPYTDEDVQEAYNDAVAQADPNADVTSLQKRYDQKVQNHDFDGQPDRLTEMDALVAYLQQLGTHVDFSTYNPDYEVKTQKVAAK
jgi:cytochrome c oxidase cbb3-type subunit 2